MESATGQLKTTPLYERHVALGAKMAPFGGWLMPIQYEGILAEHAHTRNTVCVFDICHMGEFLLEGDPAGSGLDRIVTQKIAAMPVGSCRYGFMLNEQGGVIDDLIVYRLKERSWMLVVNAATIETDEAQLRRLLAPSAGLRNVSKETGKLDVQGPQSAAALERIFGKGVEALAYYTFAEFDLRGEKCIISCTGYTGERGYEVYISAKSVGGLWELLLSDSSVKPAGLGCRDTLRLEMSYPLYGQDIDTGHTPLAAGLGKFVDLSKEFNGKAALLEEQKQGAREHLICFKADSRRSPRHGFGIFSEGRRIGTVTSGSFSPSLSAGIGMGYVSVPALPGMNIAVGETVYPPQSDAAVRALAQGQIAAIVVSKPFYHKKS